MSQVNAIRNPDGIWINTQCFREEGLNFQKNKYYTPEAWGSPAWVDYWKEQLRRCKEGYSVGGAYITGHHYFYLNFTQIMLTKDKSNENVIATGKKAKASKQAVCPDFWDGDYNYFHALDIASEGCTSEYLEGLHLDVKILPKYLSGGYHMIVGKARRKGYSYKNAAICANIYNAIPDSLTIIGAFDKKFLYPRGTMGMTSRYLDFLNDNTGWRKAREYVDKQEHKRASYRSFKNGVQIEKGYQSEVMAITFKDNPDAARGKDAKLILFEEAGKFPNLKDSYMATKESLEDGAFVTGQMVIFGTGGDMEDGTIDFADMFYNPEEYDLLPFVNIWDENADQTNCGFFHPENMNLVGFYDEVGNSKKEEAKQYEIDKRNAIRRVANSSFVLQKRVQEKPLCPQEAFLTASMNDFPIVELQHQLDRVKRENLHVKKGIPCLLYRDDTGKVRVDVDLDKKLIPLHNYKIKEEDIRGCVIIYEYPTNNAPKGLYKIGHDPYRQNQAFTSTSLGATYVYKGFLQGSVTSDQIVASYIGRPNTSDDYNRTLEMLAELYNTEIGYENEVTEVKSYFEKKRKLHLLAAQPDSVISANIKSSKVSRVYGIHMHEKLKDAGEKYIKKWLLTEKNIDENGEKILNLNTIYDIGLLEELIQYNRKGNFDRCLRRGTKISTIEGSKNVEDINIGDLVLTHTGSYKKVTMLDNHLNKNEIVELDICGEAETLTVTGNHPILIATTKKKKHKFRKEVFNNVVFKDAISLTDKYQFALLPKRNNLKKNSFSDDLLYLIGWCLGDGYVNIKNNKIEITLQGNQENIADRLIEIIDNFVSDEVTISKNRTYSSKKAYKTYGKNSYYIRINKTSKKLTDLLISVGCIPHNKHINKNLFNSSNLMPLVIGYLEADGHQKENSIGKYKRCNIEVSSIYKELILQIRQILIDNNIWSSLSNVTKGNQLRLNISTNYINTLLSFYDSLKFKKIDYNGRKEIQFLTDVGFWTPIKIKNIFSSEEIVYNFEVEQDNTYVANNIVTHNCMAFMILMMFIEEDGEKKILQQKNENNREFWDNFAKSLFTN